MKRGSRRGHDLVTGKAGPSFIGVLEARNNKIPRTEDLATRRPVMRQLHGCYTDQHDWRQDRTPRESAALWNV